MRRDVAYDIAAHVARARFSDLPDRTVKIAKKFILDTLGVAIAGSAAPGCGEVASYFHEVGGKQESSIIQYGYKVPNFHAVLVNSMMCHALDFDECHEASLVHSNITILPTALAVAESMGGVSGERFLIAYALGIDFACRLGLATGLKQGWHYSSVCGCFGSALTSAKMLDLNETEILNTLGIAYSQVAGTQQPILDKALIKRMQPGLAARGGVLSAMLAQRGITGSKGIFEGELGFFNRYERGNADLLRKDLGKTFEVDNLSMKLYPACMCTHGAITGALELVKEHRFQLDEIRKVEVIISPYSYSLIGAPFEIRDNPQVDAQFSGAYNVAAAIVRRKFGVSEIQEESIRDPQILTLTKRVTCTADDSIKTDLTPVTVRIDLRDGKSFLKRINILKGNPGNPTTEEEDIEKFKECVKFGVKKMSDERRDKLIQLILHLESLRDVRELIEYLVL